MGLAFILLISPNMIIYDGILYKYCIWKESAFRDLILPVNIWMTSPNHLISPDLHFIICMKVRYSLKFLFPQKSYDWILGFLGFPLCWMLVVLYARHCLKQNEMILELKSLWAPGTTSYPKSKATWPLHSIIRK